MVSLGGLITGFDKEEVGRDDEVGTDGMKTRVEVGLGVGNGLDEVGATDEVDVEETETRSPVLTGKTGDAFSPGKETKNRPA